MREIKDLIENLKGKTQADSELEAIIKACEFILTKRNQNENK